VVAGVVTDPESAYEAVADGQGIFLLPQGNAPVLARDCVRTVPVTGLPPSELALVWRADAESLAVSRLLQACLEAGLDLPD
jgi:DNA-binding transcriptional LysR family regulator